MSPHTWHPVIDYTTLFSLIEISDYTTLHSSLYTLYPFPLRPAPRPVIQYPRKQEPGVSYITTMTRCPMSHTHTQPLRVFLCAIDLQEFRREDARPLETGLNAIGDGNRILDRIFFWTNGPPYLTQRLCREISESPPQPGTMKPWTGLSSTSSLPRIRRRMTTSNLCAVPWKPRQSVARCCGSISRSIRERTSARMNAHCFRTACG